MALKKTGSYKGKSNKLGGGGRFAQAVDSMVQKGMSPAKAKAITAAMGRKKYGKSRFQSMAAKGRKRAK